MKPFVIAAILLLALMPLATAVHAQTPPHVFVGEATIDGAPVPDGTIIQGVVDGKPVSGAGARATVVDGKFTLFVAQPTGGSKSVNFAVGDYIAEQSYIWEIGGATVLNLDATSQLSPVQLMFEPAPPQMVKRGDRIEVVVNANTGFYRASSGEVEIHFNPNIFRLDTTGSVTPVNRIQETKAESGLYQASWSFHSPTSTEELAGELVTITLVALDTALPGETVITATAGLTSLNGDPFVLEPPKINHRINVQGLSGDFNEDRAVDFLDLAVLGSIWGKRMEDTEFDSKYDIDSDGLIGVGDLVALIQSYGIRE